MGAVNFYLKKPEPTTGTSLIYLQYKYNGNKLTFSFGQTIKPKNWNKAKQRVKSNQQTTDDGQYSLNDLLDNLENLCKKIYYKEIKNGIPQPQVIKKHLLAFFNQNEEVKDKPTLYNLIQRFIDGEIKHKGKDKAKGTLSHYKVAFNHLKRFELIKKYKVDFDTITIDFFYKYVSYLRSKGLSQNSLGKQINYIKTFMNEAIELKLTTNIEHKSRKFTVTEEATDAVYLTEGEITKLYEFDLSANKRLEQVCDLFVFGCYVGLRFSDYSEIKAENIITIEGEKFIKIITRKTNEQVIIPCNNIVQNIFEKYANQSNSLPKTISNQKFNNYIKEVCKLAGLTEKGRLVTEPEKELWECVSSHTARRSFATNLYLEGYPTLEIMKITGHRTEKAFLTYIKVSKLDAAKRLSKHMQSKWSEKLIKVPA